MKTSSTSTGSRDPSKQCVRSVRSFSSLSRLPIFAKILWEGRGKGICSIHLCDFTFLELLKVDLGERCRTHQHQIQNACFPLGFVHLNSVKCDYQRDLRSFFTSFEKVGNCRRKSQESQGRADVQTTHRKWQTKIVSGVERNGTEQQNHRDQQLALTAKTFVLSDCIMHRDQGPASYLQNYKAVSNPRKSFFS